MFASRQLHACSCGKGHLLNNDSVKTKKGLNIINPATIHIFSLVAAHANRPVIDSVRIGDAISGDSVTLSHVI